MSKQKSKFQGLFEPPASQPDQPTGDQAMKNDTTEEILQERKEEIKNSRIQERVKTNYEIRRDYVQALKRVAVDEDRKIYEVMEQAISEYLERHQESKT